ncbi:GNAT family N-acetyltransferase [Amycolatopsis alkalitolerans]|uniref:GNAT family N-acetyltransferase n=1 Tax=Amycolatopsis alkalitolerans TaxID=2547244 RepID=A0A5C4M126_9PSEU|nr:GNAT family N-acetyltransferase [Amycolatopsis alkalitolerans]TNC25451.1 GNAT family N-acetyltransferase [Amycolatopsis alkalitolerans]
MSDYTVRVLRPDETREAADLFRTALLVPPLKDEEVPYAERMYQPGRALGAFDTELIGTARSFDAELTVPGGEPVPFAAVTGVGVRADRTRRGVLGRLMRAQLTELAGRGVPLAALYASEGPIYGRFGYGVATVVHDYQVERRRAVLRPEVPAGGEIELLRLDAAVERLPALYAGLPRTRSGSMTRPAYWWPGMERTARQSDTPPVTIVHHGPNGPEGYAIYRVNRKSWQDPSILEVADLRAATAEAFAGLWRYLLAVDLVDTIEAPGRPLDEPIPLLFADPRAAKVTGGGDDLWLRLVDVPAALAAREYEGEPVVLEVTDPVLTANSGRYRVGPEGVTRAEAPAQLGLGVDALAMLYFGAWAASALVTAGRIQVAGPDDAERADRLFATRPPAWCGTHF